MAQPLAEPHYASKSAQRWERDQQRTQNWIPSWRTPQRQAVLIRTFQASLALGYFTAVASLFYPKSLLLWIPFTILMCTAWTMLRITISSRDTAPLEVLDEYEISVLEQHRRWAYSGLSASIFIISMAAIALGSVTMNSEGSSTVFTIDASYWLYFLGLLSTLLFLTFSSLPAIGYARNFPAYYPVEN